MNTTTTVAKVEKSKISVKNLDFFYGKFHALKNINIETVSYTHLTLPTNREV